MPNRYRAVFVGLANDRTDGDGQALPPGERNYLELYGIPPSLSVLRARFLADAARTCEASVDTAELLAVDSIETFGSTTEKKEATKHRLRGLRLEAAQSQGRRRHAGSAGDRDPRYAGEVKSHLRVEAEHAAFAEVEKRLVCEGCSTRASTSRACTTVPCARRPWIFSRRTTCSPRPISRAERWRPWPGRCCKTISRPAPGSGRAGRTRRPTSSRTAAPSMPCRRAKRGKPAQAAQLQERRRETTCQCRIWWVRQPMPSWRAWACPSPEDALAFFRRHPESDFRSLRAAVRFPALPEYYGPHMDLLAEIDRGDVWYDFPFDGKGNRVPQPRDRYPSFTLFVKWRGEKVPLANWRTTIGGWRSELASDGEEYYRYKDSDVGKRVWRHIVAAPVWLPPTTRRWRRW